MLLVVYLVIFQKNSGAAITAKGHLRAIADEEKVKGFVDVLVTPNVTEGLSALIQTTGLGGMKPNTVILGWPYGWRNSCDERTWRVFLQTVRNVTSNRMALLVPKGINFYPNSADKIGGCIDIWWVVHDGGLLMLLPFLLKQHRTWKNCKMRIFTVAQMEDNSIQMKKDLKKLLYNLRIEGEIEIVEMTNSDISAYTYERTLVMEQRNQMLRELQLNKKEAQGLVPTLVDFNEVQAVVDHHHNVEAKTATKVRFEEPVKQQINGVDQTKESNDCGNGSDKKDDKSIDDEQSTQSNKDAESSTDKTPKTKQIKPDEDNVRRMHTAVKLNEVIQAKSRDAQLVILNLPGPPRDTKIERESNYMEFLEVLTDGLEKVLMVHGAGREVITMYS